MVADKKRWSRKIPDLAGCAARESGYSGARVSKIWGHMVLPNAIRNIRMPFSEEYPNNEQPVYTSCTLSI